MNFTAHNIALNNGHRTMGDQQVLLTKSKMWTSIEETLNLFFPQSLEARSKLRVVDLGCLEGGFAVEFAKLGFNTLGIEAREENIKKCNYVKSNLELPGLDFVQDDVRNLKNYGVFDITVCYGLLYHLNDPVNFLKLLSSCTSKVLFLNTHFAPERDMRYRLDYLNRYLIAPIQKRSQSLGFKYNYRLSKIDTNEGYKGRWYKEWDEKSPKHKIEKMVWASYNNSKSFWLCKKDLTNAIQAAGFDYVFEQFNFTGDLAAHDYTERYNRTMFVALKK